MARKFIAGVNVTAADDAMKNSVNGPLPETIVFVRAAFNCPSYARTILTTERWIHSTCRRDRNEFDTVRNRAAGCLRSWRKIYVWHDDVATFLMSNDQSDDDPANDTDDSLVSHLPVDKHDLLGHFADRRACAEAVTSSQKAGTIVKRNLADPKGSDDDSRVSGDICRICHMGSFSTIDESRAVRGWQDQIVRGVDSRTSTLSSYAYLGPLISACKCRGTVALVHAACLERWLTESGHTRCELCGYKYATKRVPRHSLFRSVMIWFNSVVVTRQMLLDILYLVVTTPLALFSCYICILALKMLLKNGLQEMPWVIVAMLPTCSLTLIAYWGWVITLARLHGRRWRRYWRNNFVIRLIPDDTIVAETDSRLQERADNCTDGRRSDVIDEGAEIHDAASSNRTE